MLRYSSIPCVLTSTKKKSIDFQSLIPIYFVREFISKIEHEFLRHCLKFQKLDFIERKKVTFMKVNWFSKATFPFYFRVFV